MAVDVAEGREASGGQLDEVLVPDPANQVVRIVLVLREPKLALFANDIEDLWERISTASPCQKRNVKLTSPAT